MPRNVIVGLVKSTITKLTAKKQLTNGYQSLKGKLNACLAMANGLQAARV